MVLGRKQQAFTLVELSIVMVVIGLVAGGVLVSQSLIRNAELNNVITEYTRFYTATQAFRTKYLALPGDMSNATAFWGDSATYCSDAAIADGNPGTCNGNGNGSVEIPGLSGPPITGEMFQFWNQLALAGLIEGRYSGITDSGGGAGSLIGVNSPASRVNNAGWNADYRGDTGSAIFFDLAGSNLFQLGAKLGSSLYGPFATGQEAQGIDAKLDDGKPDSGTVRGVNWSQCTNAANSGDTAAAYKVIGAARICALAFIGMP